MAAPSTSEAIGNNYPESKRLPPGKVSWQKFICDSDAGTFLGRTGTSWAKIGAFYVVFFAFLAGWFSLFMYVFYQTISYDQPSYAGQIDSILRSPGLGFRPQQFPYEDKMHRVTYDISKEATTNPIVKEIDELLKRYDTSNSEVKYRDCMENSTNTEEKNRPCHVSVSSLQTSCTRANRWGYSTLEPCFFFKLNKMIGFMPEPIKDPSVLPAGLRDYITTNNETASEKMWTWCESEMPDVWLEQASAGLPINFYPYTNQPGFLSPLSVIRVRNVTKNTEVKLRCKLWAENVKFKAETRVTGMAAFIIRVLQSKEEL